MSKKCGILKNRHCRNASMQLTFVGSTCVPGTCATVPLCRCAPPPPFSCTRAHFCLPGVPVQTLCRSFVFSFLYFLRSAMNRYFLPEVQFATPLDPTCLRLQNPKAVTTWFTSYAPCLSKKQALPVNILQIRFSAFPPSAEVCAQKWTISIIFSKNFKIAPFGWLIKYQEYLHY